VVENVANIAELMVTVGADISDFSRDMSRVSNEMSTTSKKIASGMGPATEEFRKMQREIKEMEMAFKVADMKAMLPFKKQLMGVKGKFVELAGSMGSYKGTNDEFINSVRLLGAEQKKAQDALLNANRSARTSILQTAGTMMNMSTQASKISDGYKAMKNPMYAVNGVSLKIADGLNKIALNGDASVLALKRLGPNASMKSLRDEIAKITQGQMRFASVALASGLVATMVYGKLHEAAMKSNAGYAESFNTMVSKVKEAFAPMVEVFAQVMTKVYDFISVVADLVIQFNEANPVLAKMIQGFLMLLPALTLLLSPLAVGIGLVGGMASAFSSLWMLIGPLVTGLGAMMGTVLLVAGVIVAFGAAFVLAYQKIAPFREFVNQTFTAVKQIIMNALSVVLAFVREKLAMLTQFWNENGAMILQAVANIWNAISPIIDVALKLALAVVKFVWNAIKGVIDGALNVIMGLIKIFAGLFTGNFSKMWEGVKQLFSGAIKLVWNLMSLSFVGAIRKLVMNFVKVLVKMTKGLWDDIALRFMYGKDKAVSLVNALKSKLVAVWTAIKTVVVNAAKALWSGVKSIFNSLKSGVSSIFNSVKSTASTIWNGLKTVITTVAKLAWNGVKNTFNTMKSTLSGIFNGIKSTATTIFNGVKTAITKPIDTAKTLILKAVDAIKSAFNNLRLKIPKPKIPKISIGKKKDAFFGFDVPSFNISWNAKGGIFNGATLLGGGQGVGEAGAEAVLPIQHKRYMAPFASAVAGHLDTLGTDSKETVVHNTVHTTIELDGEVVGRKTEKYVSRQQADKKNRMRRNR
jgi:phage-related protein